MRKKILSFVLMISIFSSLFAALPIVANATETATINEMPVGISSVDYAYLDGKLTVKVNFDHVNEEGVVYLALYDSGRLTHLEQSTLSAGDEEKTIEMTCENEDEDLVCYDTKIICWGGDNLLTPIAAHVDIPELIRRLRAVSCEIEKYTSGSYYSHFNTAEKRGIMIPIKTCIDEAVELYAEELINEGGDFIKRQYEKEIDNVQGVYNGFTEEKKEAFKGKLASLTTANLMWLAEFFNIDIESIE